MKMIEISALENGAHRNQTYNGTLPEGWAIIPDDMECENFPFGEVTVNEVKGVPTVTSWTPIDIPETKPEPTPSIPDAVTWDVMAKAIAEGVNEV